MRSDRRNFLLGVSLLLPLSVRPALAQLTLPSLFGGGGGGADPAPFVHHITVGTRSFLIATAAMNNAIGQKAAADRMQSFVNGTKGDLTGDNFKQAAALLSEAKVPSDAQIKLNKADAARFVTIAWVFGTLAGFADKLAVDDARALAASRSPDPRIVMILPTAIAAVSTLPTHIQGAITIIGKSAAYMSSSGMQKVSAAEATRMVNASMPDAGDMKIFS